MLKETVQRGHIDLPPLAGDADWDGMAPDDHEVGVGKCRLQKARHEKVPRSFLHAYCLALVPVGMPARVQSGNILRRQQFRSLRSVGAWFKSESPSSTIFGIDRVDILQKLPLVHVCTGVLKPGAVFQSRNIATEHAGAASV